MGTSTDASDELRAVYEHACEPYSAAGAFSWFLLSELLEHSWERWPDIDELVKRMAELGDPDSVRLLVWVEH